MPRMTVGSLRLIVFVTTLVQTWGKLLAPDDIHQGAATSRKYTRSGISWQGT
ncbi:hypothetical protein SEVIR_5G403750v4 [Setaria viridis]